MEDNQKRAIRKQWNNLKDQKTTKGDRLKIISKQMNISQKAVKTFLIEDGIWYDSASREKKWSKNEVRRSSTPTSESRQAVPDEVIAKEYLRAKWAKLDEIRYFEDNLSAADHKSRSEMANREEEAIKQKIARKYRITSSQLQALISREEADKPGVHGTKYSGLVRRLRADCERRERERASFEKRGIIETLPDFLTENRQTERATRRAEREAHIRQIKNAHKGSMLDRSLQFWGVVLLMFVLMLAVTAILGAF